MIQWRCFSQRQRPNSAEDCIIDAQPGQPPIRDWRSSMRMLFSRPVLTMLFLGFSAGIPLLLIFSSLSLWLREAGVDRSTVTYFSWAALAFSFKFLWAPLVDRMPLPVLTNLLGRRRGWLLLSQLCVAGSILLMSQVNPSTPGALNTMALAVVMLGFSAATQDIVIDAFRIESADKELQALLSSTYIAGYRIGMLTSGAGALVLASYFGSSSEAYDYSAWRMTYMCMALTMGVGLLTTLLVHEPLLSKPLAHRYRTQEYLKFLMIFLMCIGVFVMVYLRTAGAVTSIKQWVEPFVDTSAMSGLLVALWSFLVETLRLCFGFAVVVIFVRLIALTPLYEKALVHETYVEPVLDFFQRYGLKLALLLLLFVGFYRVSDIVLGVISNVFFQDMGFTKNEIATVVKTFGLLMTILGGFLGGFLALRFGVMKTLYLGAFLTVATNLLFMLLAQAGHDIMMLYVVISADNLTAGLASAAFVAFLSSLTNISFTAVQYAIFSSLMTLLPKMIGGYSGSMVDTIGYEYFFLVASLIGLPVLVLIYLIQRHAQFRR